MNKAAQKKLAVFFPGRNYSVDSPLFYYAIRVCEGKGYEILKMDYKETAGNPEEVMSLVRESALRTMKTVSLADYSEFLFISNSIGTIIAGWVEEPLKLSVRHIFLTPLPGTLRLMKPGRCLVIAGDQDYVLKKDQLKAFCDENCIALWQAPDGGHSLNVKGHPEESIRILGEVVRLYDEFA